MPLAGDDVDVLQPVDGIELAKDVDLALLAVDFQKIDARQFVFREELADGDGVRKLPGAVGELELVAGVDVVSFLAAVETEDGEVLRPAAALRRIPDQQFVVMAERLEAVDR